MRHILIGALTALAPAQVFAQVTVAGLRVEYLTSPIGIIATVLPCRRPRAFRASLRHEPRPLRGLSQRTTGRRPALRARLDLIPPAAAVPDLRCGLAAATGRQHRRRDAGRWLVSGKSRVLRPTQSLWPAAGPARAARDPL